MHQDHEPYVQYTSKARMDKAINTLIGVVEGISIDAKINDLEIEFLRQWVEEHQDIKHQHPFTELLPVVADALTDCKITIDERDDILYLCEKLTSKEYYDRITADLQKLHAIMGGIVADSVVTEEELKGLSVWIEEHEHLKKCYPYDEVSTIISSVMADNKIDPDEQKQLRQLFSEFIQVCDDKIIKCLPVYEESSIKGLCAMCPEIVVKNSLFCFTGASNKYSRKEFANLITKLGGKFTDSISMGLNYLVIGAEGNPCWAYSCYGRKVEAAVKLRKQGIKLLIVHEYDFHDAISDLISD
jgi:hypothetical protein